MRCQESASQCDTPTEAGKRRFGLAALHKQGLSARSVPPGARRQNFQRWSVPAHRFARLFCGVGGVRRFTPRFSEALSCTAADVLLTCSANPESSCLSTARDWPPGSVIAPKAPRTAAHAKSSVLAQRSPGMPWPSARALDFAGKPDLGPASERFAGLSKAPLVQSLAANAAAPPRAGHCRFPKGTCVFRSVGKRGRPQASSSIVKSFWRGS